MSRSALRRSASMSSAVFFTLRLICSRSTQTSASATKLSSNFLAQYLRSPTQQECRHTSVANSCSDGTTLSCQICAPLCSKQQQRMSSGRQGPAPSFLRSRCTALHLLPSAASTKAPLSRLLWNRRPIQTPSLHLVADNNEQQQDDFQTLLTDMLMCESSRLHTLDSWTGPLSLSLSRAFFRFSLLLRFDFFTLCVLSLSLFSFLRFLSLSFFRLWCSSELLLSLPLLPMSMHLMDSSQRCKWKTCSLT